MIKYKSSTKFPTTTDNSLNSILHIPSPVDYFYGVRESWVKEVGAGPAFLYALITALSKTHGYCFMGNEALAKKLGKCLRTIENQLAKLEKKKWIFRNTYSIRAGGSLRHIITRENGAKYWNNFLSKPQIPEKVKKDFLNHFFNNSAPGTSPCTPDPLLKPTPNAEPHFCSGQPNRTFVRPDISMSKKVDVNRIEDKSIGSLTYKTLLPKIEKELAISKFQGELFELGVKFTEQFQDEILTKDNPVGFVISSLKKGYAADRLHACKIDNSHTDPPYPDREINRSKAKALYHALKPLNTPTMNFYVDDYSAQFAQGRSCRSIGFDDPSLDNFLNLTNKTMNDNVCSKRETYSLATG